MTQEIAYFAGGCFWGTDYFLRRANGVLDVTVGYMGGDSRSPTYEEVCTGETGHIETNAVAFDPAVISYESLAKLFFEIHDPTQVNRQGPDIGEQYQSVVFYTDDKQKAAAERLIDRLSTNGLRVVTKLRPAQAFWKAEDYHQNYYGKNGKQPYCHGYVKRF